MAKKKGSSKKSGSSRTQEKLEALRRSQHINAILESGDVQSQALLSGAGDSRPVDELHVSDLLEGKLPTSLSVPTNEKSPSKEVKKAKKSRK